MSDKKEKLPSLGKVKKFLYADWALRVKTRDDWRCLLCGSEENLTAHHWFVSDHHAHAARYSVDNGATLCYACHIRAVHQRADYWTVRRLFEVIGPTEEAVKTIEALMLTELETTTLRSLWNERRAHPAVVVPAFKMKRKGTKTFATVFSPRPVGVPGSVLIFQDSGRFEVTAMTKVDKGFRYTVKEVEG